MTDTAAIVKNKRYPWLAVTLSLIMPGLGHIYCGRIVKGLILSFLAGLPLPVIMFVLATNKTPFVWVVILTGLFASMFVQLIAIIDSGYTAKHTRGDYKLKEYNRWYVYILLILMGTGSALEPTLHIKANYMEAFRIAADSMVPNLLLSDRILANKLAYESTDPRKGDIVLFVNPNNRHGCRFIKRIVALAGDTVEIKENQLYINDQKLQRQQITQAQLAAENKNIGGKIYYEINNGSKYKISLIPSKEPPVTDFAQITVPPGYCFVLGDNRNNSNDSRHFGPVPLADIKARVDYLYCPVKDWSRFGKLN